MASDRFVSRGGEKLQAAIENWKLRIKNLTALDVGSSTGGFVDCLLQNGAAKVYAVDTAYGEFAWKLRNDPRIVVMERTNVLHLHDLPISPHPSPLPKGEGDQRRVDLITIDAGWTRLELILPVIRHLLKPDGMIIALLKPHYQSQKQFKGGIVPKELVEGIKDKVLEEITDLDFKIEDVMDSPILGGAGNQEYLVKITLNHS